MACYQHNLALVDLSFMPLRVGTSEEQGPKKGYLCYPVKHNR